VTAERVGSPCSHVAAAAWDVIREEVTLNSRLPESTIEQALAARSLVELHDRSARYWPGRRSTELPRQRGGWLAVGGYRSRLLRPGSRFSLERKE